MQSLALQAEARAFTGTLTAFYDGKRIPIDDAAAIPASLRGYVQLALDHGLINARFTVTQGPFDLQPTLHAYFDPGKTVTRAAYAVAAGRYMCALPERRGLIRVQLLMYVCCGPVIPGPLFFCNRRVRPVAAAPVPLTGRLRSNVHDPTGRVMPRSSSSRSATRPP